MMHKLSAHIAGATKRALPKNVAARAKLVLDAFARPAAASDKRKENEQDWESIPHVCRSGFRA